jgi:hypothetical protein
LLGCASLLRRLEGRKLRFRFWIIGIVAVLFMIAGRVFVGGLVEDSKAGDALRTGDATEAITAYDRSLHWYLPGSPTVTRAVQGLSGIARKAEAEGDNETALRAWRVLRSGLYGSEWLFVPRKDVINLCDKEISRLVSLKAAEPERDEAFRREMSILKKPVGPKKGWSVAALAGFFGWIASAVFFIFRAFGPNGEFHRRPAWIWGLIFLISYGIWMASLVNA